VSILLTGLDRFREAGRRLYAVAAHTIDIDQDILTTSRLPELALGPHGCQQADTLGVKYVTTTDATGRKNPGCQSSGGTRDAVECFGSGGRTRQGIRAMGALLVAALEAAEGNDE
jgi:hypothetical protein